MILLDSDVLVLDLRYAGDPRFSLNRQVLQLLHTKGLPRGITQQAWLEVIGVLSFNVSAHDFAQLPNQILMQYRLALLPDIQLYPDYAGCSVHELITQIGRQMALADAVQAVQIACYAPFAGCLLTWNARHFQGKMAIPVLTPPDWLNQQTAGTP